jgi:hypothetical protein
MGLDAAAQGLKGGTCSTKRTAGRGFGLQIAGG